MAIVDGHFYGVRLGAKHPAVCLSAYKSEWGFPCSLVEISYTDFAARTQGLFYHHESGK